MIVAIWGRDGSGKSTMADALAERFSKDELTAVVDTDLTQPTLPVRMPGKAFEREFSLGRAVSGTGLKEAEAYLHQHPKVESLFFAGLTGEDDYLSFEIGLDGRERAEQFITGCSETVDHIILDCSGQRTDPFVPVALKAADAVVILITPDPQDVWWWTSVKPLLTRLCENHKVYPVLSQVQPHHNPKWVQEATGTEFSAVLPWCRELGSLHCEAELPGKACTSSGREWNKQAGKLFNLLRKIEGENP